MTALDLLWIVPAAVLAFLILPTFLIAYIIYSVLLVRTRPEKWGRECPLPEDPEYFGMYRTGLAWREANAASRREVRIRSGRLELAGEFYDFGGTEAVIIIPGRTESCFYSAFYAEPYREMGISVLVIDNRAHGLSGGRVSCVGYREYRDLFAWIDFLTSSLGITDVYLHGICIGASTALFAAASGEAPDAVRGLVVEGMFKNFFETYKKHAALQNRPKLPLPIQVMFWVRLISHGNAVTDGPFRRIRQLSLPICFLHSRVDEFSDPALAERMYEDCPAPKRIVWFDKGAHSRVRVNNPERYDAAVTEFVTDLRAGIKS